MYYFNATPLQQQFQQPQVSAVENHDRSYWIPGSYAPALSEKRNPFLRLLKNKGFKEERRTKVGLYAIGKTTTLESNKSLGFFRRAGQNGRFQVHGCPQTRRGVVMLIEHQAIKPDLLTIFIFMHIAPCGRTLGTSTFASRAGSLCG